MQSLGKQFLFVIAGLTLVPGSQAQTIYRCGNAYSQTPCPDGTLLNLNDRREPDQKKQTDAAADQAARLARNMEQTRIAEEKRLLAGLQAGQLDTSDKAAPPTSSTATGALKPKPAKPKRKKAKP